MFFRRKTPENANNHAEQASDDSDTETEYPALDPEAAKRRIAEYKAAHSNAVEDIDKAYAMATAEDPYRTIAANARAAAKTAFKEVVDIDKRANDVELRVSESIPSNDLNAYNKFTTAAENMRRRVKYDEEAAISFEEKAKKNDAIAEQRGREASIAYDEERLDPKAEEEAKQDNIANYKAAYPDAVEDIEKAHFMAEAGNKLESSAATSKEKATDAFKAGDYDSAKSILERAKKEREAAHKAEEEAGEFYDQMKGI